MNEKKQVEFRYYDIPQGDIVLALTGEGWNKEYGEGKEKLHFHNYYEVGHCYARQDPFYGHPEPQPPLHPGMVNGE